MTNSNGDDALLVPGREVRQQADGGADDAFTCATEVVGITFCFQVDRAKRTSDLQSGLKLKPGNKIPGQGWKGSEQGCAFEVKV